MATQMIDIGLAGDDDLAIATGDFFMTESTAQHQQQLILNNKGDFKQHPTICVGAFGYLDDERYHALVRAVSLEFARDSMDVKSIKLSPNGVVHSDAFYQ